MFQPVCGQFTVQTHWKSRLTQCDLLIMLFEWNAAGMRYGMCDIDGWWTQYSLRRCSKLFFFFPMAPTGAYMHVVSVIMLCKTHWTGPDCKEKQKTIRPNILWDKGALMRLPCTLSNCILKACNDGASTISLGRLLQGWTVPTTRSSCSQLKSI